MRKTPILFVCVAAIAYGYGVYSHAYRSFPIEEIGAVKRLIRPDRGRPTGEEDAYLTRDARGREEVSCASLRKDAAVVLVMGQSNAANYGETRRRARRAVYNYNWMDGRCYRAEDPLLGATGDGGSIWTRLGDALIERSTFREVLLAPIAVGGTTIRDWAGPNGPSARAVATAHALAHYGLTISHVVWQQGAADHDTPRAVYVRLFSSMVEYLRGNGIDAPIFVAVETICGNDGVEAIRQAQYEIPQRLPDVFPGPDADTLDRLADRQPDSCHYSDRGLDALARMWSDVFIQYNAEMALTGRPPAGSNLH